MALAITAILAFLAGIWLLRRHTYIIRPFKDDHRNIRFNRVLGGLMAGLGVFGIVSTSFVIIGPNSVGHMVKIYLGQNMAPGQIVAVRGQMGPQARVLPPGFHFIPFVRVIYNIEERPLLTIPENEYGLLEASDGIPLRDGQFLADPWAEQDITNMLDAEHFLSEGNGQKGPQLTVLRPGKYRLNQYLFSVKKGKALDVPTGHVAVIRSNVRTRDDCPDKGISGSSNANLSTPLVPQGCIGVWESPLLPGRYYLNGRAFIATIIPTRVQTWTYKGGYATRKINLVLEENGKITQHVEQINEEIPPDAADRAINVRVEGWTIPVDMRVVVQVHPEDAPRVVASVGTLQNVEDNIITPAIRDILRSIGGQPDRKVYDFIENREVITDLVEQAVIAEGAKAGVTIQEVRMGEPAIPPELMVARLRRQLATQLQETYTEEQKAQGERIKVERERATADQQSTLVKAEIAKAAAEHRKQQLQLEGEGEKLKLIEIAQGQEAQANVLGKDRVMQLQMLKEVLGVAVQNPDIIKVPTVQVSSAESSLEGAAAVLGASNLVNMLKQNRSVDPE